ncbi:Innexin-3 [Toxocara canis]|uniref:Innexin n=1 Tax=Toxocara canis TaxID=6265 RepID=A0A0B2V0Z5_TOXCA|nr:Innexin-3 [Toxocara canis]
MENWAKAIQTYSAARYEEDSIDRLNFRVTSLVFFAAATVILYQSFFGNLLQCWTPMQFRGGWDEYANDYCFIENTYFVPPRNRSLPDDNQIREEAKLPYYQWVPFVLALQAMSFCLPHIYWRMLNWLSGVLVRAVVSMAVIAVNPLTGVDEEKTKIIANHLSCGLQMSRNEHHRFAYSSNPIGCITRMLTLRAKCYITFCYFTMKGLFIANLLIQLALINTFLGIPDGDALTWGIALPISLFRGEDWSTTGIFPRVTMCDFEVRELGNIHRWSVQCVLPLNMFSEKIYIILWFWLHIMLVTTIINTIIWLFQILRSQSRLNFIEDMLNSAKVTDVSFVINTDYHNNLERLYNDLGWDGVLVLRIILSNAGELATISVIKHLYTKYCVDENGSIHVPQLIEKTKQGLDLAK